MKFNYKHYVPILKAKQGEFRALQETSAASKDMMTPLFETIGVSWDYDSEEEGKSIENHLNGLGQKILDSWGNENSIFVDSNLIANDRLMSDGTTHHLTYLFDDFRSKGLQVIPVTSLDRHSDYKDAVREINSTDSNGICIRLQNTDLTIPSLQNAIDDELTFYGLTASDVDLVFDVGSIDVNSLSLLTLTIQTLINNAIPHISDWRTFTLVLSNLSNCSND